MSGTGFREEVCLWVCVCVRHGSMYIVFARVRVSATHVHVPNWEPRVGGKRPCWRCSPSSTLWCGWPDAWTCLRHQNPADGLNVYTIPTARMNPFSKWSQSAFLLTSSSTAPSSGSPWRVLMEPSSATSARRSSCWCGREAEIRKYSKEKEFIVLSNTNSPLDVLVFWMRGIHTWASQAGEQGQHTGPVPPGSSAQQSADEKLQERSLHFSTYF